MERDVTFTQLAIFTAGLACGIIAIGATLAATNATGGGILSRSMAAFVGTIGSAAIS